MVKMRLVFEENDYYLSLAIAEGERLDEDDQQVTAIPRAPRSATVNAFPATVA